MDVFALLDRIVAQFVYHIVRDVEVHRVLEKVETQGAPGCLHDVRLYGRAVRVGIYGYGL